MPTATWLARCAVVLILMPGCGRRIEPPPQTHKVEGKVVYSNGTPFPHGGIITFQHETEKDITCRGEIKPDGRFQLYSLTASHKVPGAVEGPYSVMIIASSPDQQAGMAHLQKKYVVQPGDNELTVSLED